MTTAEKISAVAALISFGSMVGAWVALRLNTRMSSAHSEISIFQTIRDSRLRSDQVAVEFEEFAELTTSKVTKADERKLRMLQHRLAYAVEENLNALELACGLYVDDKVDRRRFKLFYKDEIAEVCKSREPEYVKRLQPVETSQYNLIWRVYREWNPRE
jgi:hypothetical protein